jgi:c-di-AMP phosphodiesterase-like protein
MSKTVAHNMLYLVVVIVLSIGVIHFEQSAIFLLIMWLIVALMLVFVHRLNERFSTPQRPRRHSE